MQARLNGQQAAIAGRPFTDNPHQLGSTTSRAWSKGFNEIAEQRPREVAA